MTKTLSLAADATHRLSLLDGVLNSAPVVLFAIDHEGRFTSWEGRGTESFGKSPADMIGKSCFDVWKNSEAYPDVLRALSGQEFRSRLSLPGPVHLEISYAPQRDDQGVVHGVVGFAVDVTRQRETENELREKLAIIERQSQTMQLFARVLASAPLALWAVDREGRFTMSEGKGLELLGLHAGEAEKAGLSAFDLNKDNDDISSALVRALAGEESRMVTSPAEGVHFENWYMPLRRHGDEEVYGVIGLGLDISERVRNERELTEKLELIKRQSATIRALATPIIQVWDEVLCLPVIGTVDSARTSEMMQGLLESIVRLQARYAIVDLTGVEVVDTSTADHLIQLFRAARVLGVEGILCGIRPAVAQTVVALGLELGTVKTMRSLRDALKWCIRARAEQSARKVRRTAGVAA